MTNAMPEIFTPLELLDYLESRGFRLRAKDGNIFGPRGLSADMIEMVKAHKGSLIALVTHQCPLCNQPIREAMNTENVLYLECSHDPAHFSHVIPRKRGLPTFLTSAGIKPERCKRCGELNDGDWVYCNDCFLILLSEDQEPASLSEQES